MFSQSSKRNESGFAHLFLVGSLALVALGGIASLVYQRQAPLSAGGISKVAVRSGCFAVDTRGDLQAAVTKNKCVQLAAGTYVLPKHITIPVGHSLKGVSQSQTILQAGPGWVANGVEGMLDVRSVNNRSTVSNLTLDAANRATYAMATRGVTLDKVTLTKGKCSALGITGRNVIVKNSLISDSGFYCPVSPPGNGIYMEGVNVTDKNFGPTVMNTTITGNYGPAIDVNNVYGGKLIKNTIVKNGGWAAVSLYSSSNWTLTGNTIQHPASTSVQPFHPGCRDRLPNGPGSAGLMLCRDTTNTQYQAQNNRITGNNINGFYGIVLIGDNTSGGNSGPQRTTVTGNNVKGSTVGCIDSLTVTKTIKNTWSNNNCAGANNTPPIKF